MSFRITGLPRTRFADLIGLSDDELKSRGVLRRIADHQPGFPCRVSLRDAEPGESVLLVNYEHLAVASPYRSRHAIFVRENAIDARLDVDEIPEVLATRLLSVRAFDRAGMMIDADVMQGSGLAPAISRMLDKSAVGYLHVHNAKPGCFAALVDRA